MTRMWGVDPRLLCDQHLLGEHKEMHQEAATIDKHQHGEAVARGHAESKQVDTSLIVQRHDELVVEMERRGMNHQSPLEWEDPLGIGEIDVNKNLVDLISRCPDCAQRIRNGVPA